MIESAALSKGKVPHCGSSWLFTHAPPTKYKINISESNIHSEHCHSAYIADLDREIMKSPAVILIACVLLSHVEGMAIVSNGRCLCIDDGVNFIKPANIEKIEVHSPSFSCQKMEIIVTMKNGEERKCLNPESKFAKNFIKNSQRQKRSLKRTGA
ncbi:C-X-C motif chemokine 11-1-like [Paramormyrops kingsleyae]|uniref:C-X-C motif chemokine 11-1-like n=1 Tax=Paramormyrops kingsleyae TaxID=1676925 RepID=UPI003B976A01